MANFWRILLATVVLGLWAHTFGQGLRGRAFPIFLLSGCVGFGLGDLALYHAFPRIGSRLSILLVHCLAAPFAAVVEWLWLGNRLTVPQSICAIAILAGVCLALAPGRHLQVTRESLIAGIAFGVFAAIGQASGAVLSRKAYEVARAAGQTIDGMTAAYQRILAGLAVAIVSLVFLRNRSGAEETEAESESKAGRPRWRRAWPWVVSNGLAGPALGVSCYQWALATTPTGIVLPIIAITPLMVMPLARITEGDRPTRRSLIGGVIAVIGAIVLTQVR